MLSLPAILPDLIHRFGVAGVMLGAGLEGETAVVVGGGLARKGLFSPWMAGLAAFAGSFLVDQLIFAIGRNRREGSFVQRIRKKPVFDRAVRFVERHPLPFCFGFRFLYGFRIAGPLAIGISAIPARHFAIINAVSALLWASVFTMIGYRFEDEFERALHWVGSLLHLA
jgi:membrane protein DedA with SNARE-associated domain